MKKLNIKSRILLALAALGLAGNCWADPLKVCCTTTDLGALVREVGGGEVVIVTFAKGSENAHYVEARPSFVKELSQADLYVQAGLELELGWAPVLLRSCRNARVQPGATGYLDASQAITPIEIPTVPVDRSQGDVHALGNPHYLLDPVNGLRVARLIRDRLIELRPDQRGDFEARFEAFRKRLGAALVGEKLAGEYDVEKLMILHDHQKLHDFLEQQGQAELLGGWLGRMRPMRNAPVVGDHNMWNYFFRRFELEAVGYMEPKPGLTPTTRHLGELVRTMRERNVKIVIASPYFPERHANFLAENTGARAVVLAHQVDAVEGAGDYITMSEHNVNEFERALHGNGR